MRTYTLLFVVYSNEIQYGDANRYVQYMLRFIPTLGHCRCDFFGFAFVFIHLTAADLSIYTSCSCRSLFVLMKLCHSKDISLHWLICTKQVNFEYISQFHFFALLQVRISINNFVWILLCHSFFTRYLFMFLSKKCVLGNKLSNSKSMGNKLNVNEFRISSWFIVLDLNQDISPWSEKKMDNLDLFPF